MTATQVLRPESTPAVQSSTPENASPPQAHDIWSPNAEVLEEIERLQVQKKGWLGTILLFAVTLALFLGVGAVQWSWEYAAMLMVVLMFHELGHYLAMKGFKYRNLRIFFIPLLGAAVSGQHYNIPGWKKVVVSLMGPVPGIVLGVALGVAGMKLEIPLLVQAASMTLILNAINLLPVLPLDGGRVVHSLFFSRHYLVDSGFRLLTALALLGAGIFIGEKFLAILGVLSLLSLRQSHLMARIAHDLRKRGFQAVSDDSQSIPAAQAETIIDEVKKAFDNKGTKKLIAQQTLNIFESLNARPPRWAATLGLAGLHAAALITAVVFSVWFIGVKETL